MAEAAPAGAEGDVLVAASGLTLRLGGRTILDDVSLEVRRGEIVTVIGPNGAGKTLLVRTILGLVEPTSGSVVRAPGLRVGYVPQRLAIDPVLPLTVGRFLTLGGAAPRAGVREALAETGAEARADASLHDLSGGEFQRVLLARALLRRPDLLVLDEPVQGVDVTGQHDLYGLIARLRRRLRCGVLLVSHDLHLVMAATDLVVCLNQHVCCTGHPEAVSRDPAYLALFGREAAARVAVYVHDHDHTHDGAGHVVARDEAEERQRHG